MSLILRTTCQDTLNTYGLGNFHIRINSNHHLTIAAECGKPFVTIQGIQFASGRPTQREIDAAQNLLEEFILTHREIIKTAITCRDAAARAKTIDPEDLVGKDVHFYNDHYRTDLLIKDGIMTWGYDMETSKLTAHSIKTTVTTAQVNTYKFNTALLKEAKRITKIVLNKNKLEEAMRTSVTALTVCDI